MPSRRSSSRSGSSSRANRSGSSRQSSTTRRAVAITRAMNELAITPIRPTGTPLHNLRTPNVASPWNLASPPASFGRPGVHGMRRPTVNSPNRPRVRRVIFPPNADSLRLPSPHRRAMEVESATEVGTELASRSFSRNASTELNTEIASPAPLPRRRRRNENSSRSRSRNQNGSNRSPPQRRQRA